MVSQSWGSAVQRRGGDERLFFGRGADELEQADELVDFRSGKVAEELLRNAVDDGVHLSEEVEAGLGDVGDDDAAIAGVAALADELEALESIEQAGDVGLGGDHAVADGGAGQAVGLSSSEDAQDVVLRSGDARAAGA